MNPKDKTYCSGGNKNLCHFKPKIPKWHQALLEVELKVWLEIGRLVETARSQCLTQLLFLDQGKWDTVEGRYIVPKIHMLDFYPPFPPRNLTTESQKPRISPLDKTRETFFSSGNSYQSQSKNLSILIIWVLSRKQPR